MEPMFPASPTRMTSVYDRSMSASPPATPLGSVNRPFPKPCVSFFPSDWEPWTASRSLSLNAPIPVPPRVPCTDGANREPSAVVPKDQPSPYRYI